MLSSELSSRARLTVVSGLTVMLGLIRVAVFGPLDPFAQVRIVSVIVGNGLDLGYIIVYRTFAMKIINEQSTLISPSVIQM